MSDPVNLRLHVLIASLSEAVLVEDEHRRISLTNGAFCRMFGIPAPPEAMVGADCSQAAEESKHYFRDPAAFVSRVQAVLDARETVIGDRLEMVDGRVLERDYVPVFQDGGYLGHLWKYRDVTDQVRAEERREERKKFYERVLDALPAQVAVFDRDGTYMYVSPSAIADEEMRAWLVGKTDADYCARRGLDAAIAERRMARVRQVADTGTEARFQETLPVRRTNEERHLVRFYTPVIGGDGGTELVLGYGLDITDLVRAEEKLREATRLAEQSARAKESFLANMSHEIRTPLNAVIGTAHLLDSTPLDELQRRYVDAIRYSADTLLALINDILDLTKIGTGNIAFESVPFRLPDLVNSVGDALRATAEGKGLSLHVTLDPALPPVVVGDPTRLTQVLLNLLGNAVKFTERGGVTLGVGVARNVAGNAGDALTLEFRVADTGIGIAEHQREAIFDAFTQERADTTRRYGGTGLGLAIVRELATRQGGGVRVESAVGEGSTFIVTLPARAGTMPALSPDGAGADGVVDLSGVRILLVEDNALNQFVATQLLSRAGAELVVEGNGVLALDRLRADRRFDVILMDIQMPEMDGFEATHRIRSELGISGIEIPILALTASALVEQRSRAVALGMDDFVMKPFAPDDLKRRIAAAVWRSRHARALAASTRAGRDGEPAGEVDGEGSVDFEVLEAQTLGQAEFTIEMIDVSLAPLPVQWASVRDSAAAMQREALQGAAHKLKSACAVVGAGGLHATLQSLEDLALSASATQVAMLVQEAAPEVEQVQRVLARARARYEAQLA